MIHNYDELYIPYESISSCINLKAIALKYVPFPNNTHMPDEICNLKNIIFLEMTFQRELAYLPFDCIASEWKELTYITMEVFPLIENMSPQFWQLPKLQTALLEYFELNASDFGFDSFNGFSNSLSRVSVTGSDALCSSGDITIDGTKYWGFGYLADATLDANNDTVSQTINFTKEDVEQYPILQFITKFDPCSKPCDSYAVCVFESFLLCLCLFLFVYDTGLWYV